MATRELIEHHGDLWTAATRGEVPTAIRDGSLEPERFHAWLCQDYQFVSALMPFQARLLARSPRRAQSVLARGALALVDELSWFEALAARRGISLAADTTATTASYIDLLDRLDEEPAPLAQLALWTLEQVYQDAWQYARPGGDAYHEVVDHWANPTFTGYVSGLRRLADDAIRATPDDEHDRVFVEVLRLEIAFWHAADE